MREPRPYEAKKQVIDADIFISGTRRKYELFTVHMQIVLGRYVPV